MTPSTTSGEGGEPPGGVSPSEWDGRKVPVDRFPGLHLPDWFQTLGRGAWLAVGIAVLLAIAFLVLGLISDLVIPLVFAAILAAIFVPWSTGWNAGACPGGWAPPWWSCSPSGSSQSLFGTPGAVGGL